MIYQILALITGVITVNCNYHSQDLLNFIKSSTTKWEPYELLENPFYGYSQEQIQSLFGTHNHQLFTDTTTDIDIDRNIDIDTQFIADDNLPELFDSRIHWKDCIHEIRDQQSCGSCWAFAASEVFSDTFCIQSNKTINHVFSPQDMISCDTSNFGCNGGYLQHAWQYLKTYGIVTDQCYKYSSGNGIVNHCQSKCDDGSQQERYYCSDIQIATGIKRTKELIYKYGAVETGFTVYSDFMYYKKGIYHRLTNDIQGGHAVKIIGWGIYNNDEYFICANSWGTNWGEQGYFRIGSNECGITDQVFTCTIQLQQLVIQ